MRAGGFVGGNVPYASSRRGSERVLVGVADQLSRRSG